MQEKKAERELLWVMFKRDFRRKEEGARSRQLRYGRAAVLVSFGSSKHAKTSQVAQGTRAKPAKPAKEQTRETERKRP